MTKMTRSGHRSASAAVLVVGGGALAVATWINGQDGLAVGLAVFYVVAASVAYLWAGGKGDVGALMRAGGDERQRSIDRDATSVTGLAMAVAAIVGAVIEAARHGNPGAYGVMCVVGGVSYAVTLVALRLRR